MIRLSGTAMVEDPKIDDFFRQPRYLLGPVAMRNAKINKQSATNLANSLVTDLNPCRINHLHDGFHRSDLG